MQEVFNFISRHYELIISVITLIISVVIFIVRKKPINSVYSRIWSLAVSSIQITEAQCHGSSKDKLSYCLDLIYSALLKEYPNLDITRYEIFIKCAIEIILSTPQKKEDK